MLFTESFITDAGERLLARAAAQEGRIVWTRAATSSLPSDNHQTSQMNALDESTFGTKTSSGVVTNALVNDQQNTASIYAELTNEEYDGEARTFGAWAKIEGDNTDVLVIVARCGSGVTPTTINPASAGVVKAFVDFELDITAEQAQSVQVSEGWYATQDALQDEIEARESLAGRVVTTHKAGDTNSGDDQTILGKKTFAETVYASRIEANAVVGNLNGRADEAIVAQKDDEGNYIKYYIRSIMTESEYSPTSRLMYSEGTGTLGYVKINSCVYRALQGQNSEGDTVYSKTGGIGLFMYSEPNQQKEPGDAISSSHLVPVCIANESGSLKFKTGNTQVSGTWVLLSPVNTQSPVDSCLCLAIKV